MLKTALFDCAINEKCCSVDGGRGICPLFSSPPRGIRQLKNPHPRKFVIQGKINANFRGSASGGGGLWAQLELTDAYSRLTITRTLANSDLSLTRTKIDFPWISVIHSL